MDVDSLATPTPHIASMDLDDELMFGIGEKYDRRNGKISFRAWKASLLGETTESTRCEWWGHVNGKQRYFRIKQICIIKQTQKPLQLLQNDLCCTFNDILDTAAGNHKA